MLTPINVCLLDEPTNHLDIETKELLKKAISSFEGTIIFVSHDRDFVASLADRILYLSLDHTLTDYPGNLWTFFEKYPQFIRHLDGRQVNRMSLKQTPSTDEPKNRSMDSYGERKKIRNRMRSLEKKVAEVEGVIHGLGRQKELLQEKCASDQLYTKGSEEERNRILRELGEVEKQLHDKMIEWEKLFTELEGMK